MIRWRKEYRMRQSELKSLQQFMIPVSHSGRICTEDEVIAVTGPIVKGSDGVWRHQVIRGGS